jgi:hypothetical protein
MKKALLIGINYTGSDHPLNGCINDIGNINNLLMSKYGYDSSNIVVLTDNTTKKPTLSNIQSSMKSLVSNCAAGDVLFFYYSGHGSQMKDTTGKESDGMTEVIVPIDYNSAGVISDDWLRANMINVLPSGVKMWAFTDCCHSGTMLDLKYNVTCDSSYTKGAVSNSIVYNTNEWTNKFSYTYENSTDSVADVYMFSGCFDNQTSADAYLKNKAQGAFTFCFLNFVKNNPNRSLGDMLKEINCLLVINGFQQRSQLSVGRLQDVNNIFSP